MRQGLGIQQTAEAAGISRSYLTRLELGTRTRMRPGTFAALRQALSATPDQLLTPHEQNDEKR